MNRKLLIVVAALALVGGLAVAQDLKIDYLLDLTPTSVGNYFTFTGPIRYMAVDKDHVDAKTGASVANSTELFQSYLYDVKGKYVLPGGLRGLFLFAVSVPDQRKMDNLTVTKAGDGTITVRYVHRGTAYELVTDKSGKLTMPGAAVRKRAIGFIQGEGPQVLHTDFSSDGTAAKVDWNKVWNASIAGGKEIKAGVANKTGDITSDLPPADTLYAWEGSLQFSFDKNVLKIVGGFNAVNK